MGTSEQANPDQPNLDAALAAAEGWLDTVDGVISVGEGSSGGAATVDVWVAGTSSGAGDLPERLHGVPVRVRDAGGDIEAE